MGVAVAGTPMTSNVAVAYRSLGAGDEVSSTIANLAGNGGTRWDISVGASVIDMKATDDESVVVVLDYSRSLSLELRAGGRLTLDAPLIGGALLARIGPAGVEWALPTQGEGRVSAMDLAMSRNYGVAVLSVQAPGVSIGGSALENGLNFLDFGAGGTIGAVVVTQDLGGFLSEAGGEILESRVFLASHQAPSTQIWKRGASGCTVDFDDPAREFNVLAVGAGVSNGWFVAHGSGRGVVDFGGVELEFTGGDFGGGFLASYDEECNVRSVRKTNAMMLDEPPVALKRFGPVTGSFAGHVAASPRGRTFLGGLVKSARAISVNGVGQVVSPVGESVGLILSLGPDFTFQCQ